jgi:hypothetical protein
MATYSLDQLMARWPKDELDPEQLLGHILQHLLRLEREQRILKDLLRQCAEAMSDGSETVEKRWSLIIRLTV